MLDRLDLAGELAGGEAHEDRRRQVPVDGDPVALGGVPLALDEPDRLGVGLGRDRADVSLAVGGDLRGRGHLGGLLAPVRALLAHEVGLTSGQLDLVGELVLGDRPLLVDRGGASREGGLVGVGRDPFRVGAASAFSTSADGWTALTRTEAIARPISATLASASRPSPIRARSRPTPSATSSRSGVAAMTAQACCWARPVSRAAIWSSGVFAWRPVARSIPKSIRAARVSGSTTR